MIKPALHLRSMKDIDQVKLFCPLTRYLSQVHSEFRDQEARASVP